MNPYRVPELTITPHEDGSDRLRFRGKLSSIQINDRNYTAFKNKQHFEGGGIEESKESEDSIIQRILTYNPGATERNITAYLEDKMQKKIVQAATAAVAEPAAPVAAAPAATAAAAPVAAVEPPAAPVAAELTPPAAPVAAAAPEPPAAVAAAPTLPPAAVSVAVEPAVTAAAGGAVTAAVAPTAVNSKDSTNTITIDGLTFTLLNKSISHSDRRLIIFKCNDKEYVSYKSNSDVNWRLAFKLWGGYDKGTDYITTTQIHQDLQCFFNDMYDKLDELNDSSKINEINTRLVTEDFYEILHKESYDHDVFNTLMISCPTGTNEKYCFTHHTIFNQFDVDKIYGTNTNIYITKMKEIMGTIRTVNSDLFQRTEDELKLLTHYKYVSNTVDRNMLYNLMIQAFSEYMKHFFTAIGTPTFVCNRHIRVPYNALSGLEQPIVVSVYKITLKLNTDNKQFILYYGTYNYKQYVPDIKEISPDSTPYKIILNLIPIDNKITEYGMYDNFISAGIYVYKMFEYHQGGGVKAQVDYENPLPGSYTFIGDLLSKMYPLQDLHEPPNIETAPKSSPVAPTPPAAEAAKAAAAAAAAKARKTRKNRR